MFVFWSKLILYFIFIICASFFFFNFSYLIFLLHIELLFLLFLLFLLSISLYFNLYILFGVVLCYLILGGLEIALSLLIFLC